MLFFTHQIFGLRPLLHPLLRFLLSFFLALLQLLLEVNIALLNGAYLLTELLNRRFLLLDNAPDLPEARLILLEHDLALVQKLVARLYFVIGFGELILQLRNNAHFLLNNMLEGAKPKLT